MSSHTVFVIGQNNASELGLSHSNNVEKLTILKHPDINNPITSIYSGLAYTIFSDSNQRFWCVGENSYGQCGIEHFNSPISIFTAITFFNKNNINIIKIVNDVVTTLWITDDNKLYGNGYNSLGQLGIKNDYDHKNEPKLFPLLNNVIDGISTSQFSVALCVSDDKNALKIVRNWSRSYDHILPEDIVNLIIIFCKISDVYTTKENKGIQGHNQWHIMEEVKNMNIVKISGGFYHCLLLSAKGRVWGFGSNRSYQISETDKRENEEPIEITYFSDKGIKIMDIASGYHHSLVLDYDGNVYSFGANGRGQCGHGTTENVKIPKLIESLKDYEITDIECGGYHSYCKTSDGKHFLFGGNEYNECIVSDDIKDVLLPQCVNKIVEEECNGKEIISVFLGYYNTKIIVSS